MTLSIDDLIEPLVELGLLPRSRLIQPGPPGQDGVDGKSAYQIWLDQGNVGTVEDFIASLRGPNGESAYEIWLGNGNTGTEEDFILSLTGPQGIQGNPGNDGKSAYQSWLDQGNVGTEQDFLNSLRGQNGLTYWQDNYVADNTILSNKKVQLTYTPEDPTKVVVVFRQGIEQWPGIDFVVNGKELSWNQLALELLLELQDVFAVRYVPTIP